MHGGIGKLAEVAELNRESMYRMLSEDGNPRVSSLNAVLHALGPRLSIAPEKPRRSAAWVLHHPHAPPPPRAAPPPNPPPALRPAGLERGHLHRMSTCRAGQALRAVTRRCLPIWRHHGQRSLRPRTTTRAGRWPRGGDRGRRRGRTCGGVVARLDRVSCIARTRCGAVLDSRITEGVVAFPLAAVCNNRVIAAVSLVTAVGALAMGIVR